MKGYIPHEPDDIQSYIDSLGKPTEPQKVIRLGPGTFSFIKF